jgi:hypothetical protein
MVDAAIGVGAGTVGVAAAGRVSDDGAEHPPTATTKIAAATQTVGKREMILIIVRL